MFENPRRVRQARNSTANVPKILDLKSSSEHVFSENCRWVPLIWEISALVIKKLLREIGYSRSKSRSEVTLSRYTVYIISPSPLFEETQAIQQKK